MIYPQIPEEAKPHETAILLVYYGMRMQDPNEIATVLHYKTAAPVYKVLKKHRDSFSPERIYKM